MVDYKENMFIKRNGLISTKTNLDKNSINLYAKVADIKTDVNAVEGSYTEEDGKIRGQLQLVIKAFVSARLGYEETIYQLRIKTGNLTSIEDYSISYTKKPRQFDLILATNDDSSCSLYARVDEWLSLKLQILYGEEKYITFLPPADYTINKSLLNVVEPSEHYTWLGSKEYNKGGVYIGDDNVHVNMKSGGALVPHPNSAASLGNSDFKFRGAYFAGFVQIPDTADLPPNPQNGFTIFHWSLKKLITYHQGNWYDQTGTIVTF